MIFFNRQQNSAVRLYNSLCTLLKYQQYIGQLSNATGVICRFLVWYKCTASIHEVQHECYAPSITKPQLFGVGGRNNSIFRK